MSATGQWHRKQRENWNVSLPDLYGTVLPELHASQRIHIRRWRFATNNRRIIWKCLHSYTIQNAIHDKAVLDFRLSIMVLKIWQMKRTAARWQWSTYVKGIGCNFKQILLQIRLSERKGNDIWVHAYNQIHSGCTEILWAAYQGKERRNFSCDWWENQTGASGFSKLPSPILLPKMKKAPIVTRKMQKSLNDYNDMFGTKYEMSQIQSYNGNLNKRLARKMLDLRADENSWI